jgi:hypothetical protein
MNKRWASVQPLSRKSKKQPLGLWHSRVQALLVQRALGSSSSTNSLFQLFIVLIGKVSSYSRLLIISVAQNIGHRVSNRANKAFQTDKIAVSHLLQKAQKLRHNNFAAEQWR